MAVLKCQVSYGLVNERKERSRGRQRWDGSVVWMWIHLDRGDRPSMDLPCSDHEKEGAMVGWQRRQREMGEIRAVGTEEMREKEMGLVAHGSEWCGFESSTNSSG